MLLLQRISKRVRKFSLGGTFCDILRWDYCRFPVSAGTAPTNAALTSISSKCYASLIGLTNTCVYEGKFKVKRKR
jgi:hypothetical protein